MRPEPLVFNIVRGSFSDGPGVRTTVFFKGCPLKCPWCHNPESQRYEAEVMHFPELCIGCRNCRSGRPCYTFARKEVGTPFSPEALALELIKDKAYYEASGGGVTFSGGEALSFIEYLAEVTRFLKRKNISIAVQTSGFFHYQEFEKRLLNDIDLVLFDLKIMDGDRHHRVIGKSNHLILENFKKLNAAGIKILPRVALIPHYVATKENLKAIADFLFEQHAPGCEFLYYNPAAGEKLERLGRKKDPNLQEKPVPPEKNQEWIRYFKAVWQEKALKSVKQQ